MLALAGTWFVWAAAIAGLGVLIARRSGAASLWFGLGAVTGIAMLLALVSPLGAWWARIVMVLVMFLGLAVTIFSGVWRTWPIWVVALTAAFGLSLLASVEPSNYDTGLYHLGSILYVRDGGTVIGLANLHERFGFSSSMWPVSGALGLGVWNGSEFRLVNGLLIVLALMDVCWRMMGVQRRAIGTFVLSGGLLLIVGAVIQYPGRLIASSAQDTAAAILVLVSGAYLADFLTKRDDRFLASVAVLTAALAGAMRPLGWVFFSITLVVVLLRIDRKGWWSRRSFIAPAGVGALVLIGLTTVRDFLTSGWLFFPIGALPMPVAWRYPDPSPAADDIAAWARTPFGSTDETLASWDWLGGWLTRLPADWSIPALGVLIGLSVSWWLISPKARAVWQGHWRTVVWAEIPVLGTLALWFLSAPDPRFAWGLILLVGLVPLGVLATSLTHVWVWWSGVVLALLALLGLAALRGSLQEVSISPQAPPEVVLMQGELADGTRVSIPSQGRDQCWSAFPLCRPWYANPEVSLRGETWREGFLPN